MKRKHFTPEETKELEKELDDLDETKKEILKKTIPPKLTFILIFIFLILTIIYGTVFLLRTVYKPPTYIIMINPRHGGMTVPASKTNGDRYDDITGQYTVDYDGGSQYKDISEFSLLLKFTKQLRKVLKFTKTKKNYKRLVKILEKYGGNVQPYQRVFFHVFITKETNYMYYVNKKENDVNKFFRLMDFPSTGFLKRRRDGLMSKMFKMHPDIILNFDLDYINDYSSIYSINSPSYYVFNKIREHIIKKDFNFSSDKVLKYYLYHWRGRTRKEKLENMIKDTWLYFTGYLPDKTFVKPDLNNFKGIGYNMVSWKYADKGEWWEDYNDKKNHPEFNTDLKNWKPNGLFWERERYRTEIKRRGDLKNRGDNFYASQEMVKYIKSIFYLEDKGDKLPSIGKPVFAYNEISIYQNSIVININLGSLRDKKARELLDKEIDTLCNAVWVALYSITSGYKLKDNLPAPIKPNGKPLDFEHYHDVYYFGKVCFKK